MIAGVALLAVGLLGWRQRLSRNRLAGIRTPATLRSDAAFIAANRVAVPPILTAGVIYAAAGGLALGTDGPALTMIVGAAGTGAFALALAGGLLGHREVAAMPPPAGGCAGFSCRGESCGAG
ncbi:MAG: SdpI family protein [Pseudonocardiaceae bacterium]